MVKVLLSLKWRYFLASFKRNPWVIIGFSFGALYALGALIGWAFFCWNMGNADSSSPAIPLILVGFGVILSVLWWVVPLMTSGADATLDPDHLAPYPLRTKDLQSGQLLGAFIGLPGIVTVLFTVMSALVLHRHPLALCAYLICAPAGLLLLMCVSRIFSLLAIELNSLPGMRQTLTVIGFLCLMGLGPLIMVVIQGISSAWEQLPGLVSALSWTPLGAPWGVVAAIYAGNWPTALALIALSCGYFAIAWVLWRKLLERAMSKIGELTGSPSSKSKQAGNLGILKYFPQTARGAIAARTVDTLLRDNRASLNTIMIPALYILFGFVTSFSVSDGESSSSFSMNPFAIVFVPMMAGYVYAYLVSYDNSAFSLHVLAPIRGADDRWGRAIGLLVVMLPLVVLGSLYLSYRADHFATAPLLVAMAVGMLLNGIGVSAFVDMVISVPAPPPGANPFKTPQQSDMFSKGLVRMLIILILLATSIPAGIFWIVFALTQSHLWMWVSVAVALTVGITLFWLGLHLGSRRYDRYAADTLQRVSAFR